MKSFLEQVRVYRESAQSISMLSTETNSFYLKKYGVDEIGGDQIFNGSYIPGKIYVGEYLTRTALSSSIKYINRFPTFLFISREKFNASYIIKCIDLNIIPPESRGLLLTRFFDEFFPIIKRNSTNPEQEPIILKSNSLNTLFSGTGYKSAVVGFKPEYLRSVKIIDYSDWCKIPYLSAHSIQGISIDLIYKNYRMKLNRP